MTAYLLAVLSAVAYGSGDFLGGLSTRRTNALLVSTLSQAAGLGVLAAMVLLSAPAPIRLPDLAWGALAGLCGGAGVGTLYRALAIGTMSIVAPTTAVCAVAVPVLWAVARGQVPGPQASVGIVLAMLAIVLVSGHDPSRFERRPDPWRLPPGLGTALVSGVLIGGFFLALANTSSGSGWWPLLAARVTSVACFSLAMLARGRSWSVTTPNAWLIVSGGVLDMLANVLYLMAMRGGPLASVVTLASLYPASTVLLASVVLGERLSRVQAAGVAAALVAVGLIVSAA